MTNEIVEKGSIVTHIASTRYNLCRLENKYQIIKGIKDESSRIEIRHERHNFFDENAVEVIWSENRIGYIPRKINEEIAYYSDLYIPYQIEVLDVNVVDINAYIKIIIKITFQLA
jgi:hypothetical protein